MKSRIEVLILGILAIVASGTSNLNEIESEQIGQRNGRNLTNGLNSR
jgi:hypothetical protein